MGEHKVDYADLYFQTTRSEGWSLEEGIVKSGSFSIDQGVGVRAVVRREDGFAYSDDISPAALDAGRATPRAPSRAAGRAASQAALGRMTARGRAAVPARRSARHARRCRTRSSCSSASSRWRARRDPRIVQVMAGLAGEHDVVLVARSDGTLAADVRPLVRVSRHRDRRAERPPRDGLRRRRRPLRLRLLHRRHARRAMSTQAVNAGAGQPRSAPGAGRHDDRRARPGLARRAAARGDRPRPRRRLQPQGHVARSRAASASASRPRASPSSTTARSPTAAARSTSTTKAIRRQCTVLIEDGILQGYIQDTLNARLMGDAADRQRPPRIVRAHADAAHDQHLHAGRRQAIRRRSSPRSRAACTRSTSAAARSTSPAASSCSRPARPT